jgi:hypothetical protein
MTAQDVINGTSQDVRQVIQASGTGQALLLGYVDRVQKDALHAGVFEAFNRATTTLSTVATTGTYTLTPTNIRAIAFVYDRTTERVLLPIPDIVPMTPDPEQMRATLRIVTSAALPDFYRFEAPTSISFFPTPLKVVSLEVHYSQQVATVAAATDTLVVPDDGLDLMVAGTNMLAQAYLGRAEGVQFWAGLYQQLKGAPTTLVQLKPEGQ